MSGAMQAVRSAARALAAAGVETPETCAEWLLSDLLRASRPSLYADPRPLTDEQREQFGRWVDQVCAGVPPAYLTQRVWFYGLPLVVRPGVFIPRPETEVLVETIVERLRARRTEPMVAVDVGTGTGNIAISLTKLLPACRMIAVDCSEQAVAVARENVATHGVVDRVHPVQLDVRELLAGAQPLLDMIVSNPPYIASGEISTLPAVVRSEPLQALDGGEDGLATIRYLIERSPEALRSSGWLALEIGEEQAAAVVSLVDRTRAFRAVEVKRDLAGRDRVVLAQRR